MVQKDTNTITLKTLGRTICLAVQASVTRKESSQRTISSAQTIGQDVTYGKANLGKEVTNTNGKKKKRSNKNYEKKKK
jgi:hypothetical protein